MCRRTGRAAISRLHAPTDHHPPAPDRGGRHGLGRNRPRARLVDSTSGPHQGVAVARAPAAASGWGSPAAAMDGLSGPTSGDAGARRSQHRPYLRLELAETRSPAAWIEHRHDGLVGEDPCRGEHHLTQPRHYQGDFRRGVPHPERQSGPARACSLREVTCRMDPGRSPRSHPRLVGRGA